MKKIFSVFGGNNKKFKSFLKVAVSLGFVIYVIFKVDWADVLNGLGRVRWWQTLIYVATLLIGMLISSYKWKILSEYKKFKMGHFDHFKFYLAGTFINNFMPSFIGGDAYKAYQLGKKDGRFAEAASTVMIDRITGLIGAMLLALFFSFLNIRHVAGSSILIAVNIIILLSFFVDIVVVCMKKSDFWKNLVRKIIPEKILNLIKEIYSYGNNKKIIRRSVIWAIIFNFVGVAIVNYILFLSIGIKIGILDYLSVIFLTSIVASVPISVNNIGIKEWSYIAFFGALGIAPAPVITVSILSRIFQMIVSFFAVPIYLEGRYDYKKLKNQE